MNFYAGAWYDTGEITVYIGHDVSMQSIFFNEIWRVLDKHEKT
jgi:hypothetical protein